MIFGQVPLDQAQGAILAHTVRAGADVIKKGTRLTPEDIEKLKAANLDAVTAVRLESGDVGEDEVASALGLALSGEGVEASQPLAGRCNLHASVHGVVVIDRSAIDAVNRSGDGVLCATIPPYEVVEPGRAVVTVKVIPYAISEVRSDALVQAIGDNAVTVRPFVGKRVALILTEVAGGKASLLDKAREVLAARVETYGSTIVHDVRIAHAEELLAGAVRAASEIADMVLVLGGASTADIDDTVPTAIVTAGGEVELFGIPVDPGNLLVMGRVGSVPVLGLPGCARSPRLNGIDLVLSRLLAGLDVSAEALLGLGVGGLLHDVPERPQPREPHPGPAPSPSEGQVAAVVLAGGASRRMGVDNKLLKDVDGQPMVRHVVEAALQSDASPVIVVTGHEAAAVRTALQGLDVHFVHNPHYYEGLSTSVRAGVGAVPADCAGALMVLADMPRVEAKLVNALIESFQENGGSAICVPTHQGRRGNPLLWPREFFPDMLDLAGDTGARRLVTQHQGRVVEVEADSTGIFLDVDTPDDLNAL